MNKSLQPMAMFMICLILTLPIYSSSVYADINKVKAYGSQGLENFVLKEYDLTVEAEIDGSVSKDDVKLKHSSLLYTNFDSCSSGNTSSICLIKIVKGTNSEVELCPSSNLMVELYEGSSFPVDTKSLTINCDAKPPSATLSVSPRHSSGQDVKLNYNIVDPQDSSTKCSGIDKIEFYTSVSSSPATIITNSTGCSYSGNTNIVASAYEDGDIIIYLKSYDILGQSSVANTTFRVDKTGPEALASTKITDASGNSLFYFTPQNVLVDVIINITDLTGVSSYTLDHSSLTTSPPACMKRGTNVVCKWDNLNMYMSNASFSKEITINAIDSLGNNASRKIPVQGAIIQDSVPPTITVSEITIDTIDGSTIEWFRPGEMKMNFSVHVEDDLSGVESIQGDFSNLDVISGDAPSCTKYDTSYACTWSNLRFIMKAASFTQTINILAKDEAGNERIVSKSASANYKKDPKTPTTNNFKITKTNGGNFTEWIGNEVIPAKISLDVTEEGAGLENAKGLFTSINPSYSNYLEGDCTQTSSTRKSANSATSSSGIYRTYVSNTTSNVSLPKYEYTCTWNVMIHFNNSGNPLNPTLQFNVTDTSLNSANPSFTKAFKVDIDGPVVTMLGTNKVWDNKYYVGIDQNIFVAAINDQGIGMNASEAYLDLTGVGFENNKKAKTCSDGYCYWETLGCEGVSEGDHTIYVNTNTKDNLGNKLVQSFAGNVTLDKTRPSVNDVNITAVASSTQIYRDYIQTGNALYIVAEVTEDISILSATADLSNFISNETADLADDFSQDGSTWTFMWATDEIDISNYKKDNVYFNFTDIAGNSVIHPVEIEVFEALTSNVSYWSNTVGSSSPSSIDRHLVSLYTPFMWFPVSLVSSEGKSASERWPLEVYVDSCSGDNTTTSSNGNSSNSSSTPSSNYLSSSNGNLPVVVNPNLDTPTILPYQMYFDYVLEQNAPNSTDSLTITCNLKIRTLVDQQKISPEETEQVTVTIDYYNNPLGTLDANIQKEINDVKNSWLVDAEWIALINQILTIARTICGLVDKIYKITQIWAAISDASKTNQYTMAHGIITGKTAAAFGAAAEEGWKEGVNTICKFLNCQLFYGEDWGGQNGDPASAQNLFGNWGRWSNRWSRYWDPQSSLITSIVFLCIPGILYNLQKARIIECNYIRCLEQTAYGMPLQMCVTQRDYAWCNYVYSEMFNLIPFAGMISQFAQNIRKMLSQPAQAISVTLKTICLTTCTSPKPMCKFCVIIEGLGLITDVLCDFGIGSDQCEAFWEDLSVDDSACEDVL